MPLQAKLILWAGMAAALLAAIYGIYHYGRHVEGLEWEAKTAEASLKNAAANQAIVLDYTNKLIKAGVNHAENQRRINLVSGELDRVRVMVPDCPSTSASSAPAAVTNPDPSSGLATPTVKRDLDDAQQTMDEARRAINAIGERCATLNLDAIRLNESR